MNVRSCREHLVQSKHYIQNVKLYHSINSRTFLELIFKVLKSFFFRGVHADFKQFFKSVDYLERRLEGVRTIVCFSLLLQAGGKSASMLSF